MSWGLYAFVFSDISDARVGSNIGNRLIMGEYVCSTSAMVRRTTVDGVLHLSDTSITLFGFKVQPVPYLVRERHRHQRAC